jgi:RNA ligase (TIGR02306 family)
MSTFKAEVVKFSLQKHPNADLLSIATVKGWNCVVNTESFLKSYTSHFYKNVDLAVYVPIDAIAPADHPLLGFLDGKRVKTIRLRGLYSQGVLLPIKDLVDTYPLSFKRFPQEGDDVTDILGIKKWEEPIKPYGSKLGYLDLIRRPDWLSKYTDIENIKNFNTLIKEGELVHISEKLHGTSSIYALVDGVFYISSRNHCIRTTPLEVFKTTFKNKKLNRFLGLLNLSKFFGKKVIVPPPDNWWTKANSLLDLESKVRRIAQFFNTDTLALYGEIVGPSVQDLGYGVAPDKLEFYAYDLRLAIDSYDFTDLYVPPLEFDEVMNKFGIKQCPVLKIGAFEKQDLDLRSGKSLLADHVKEGVVIKPLKPRTDPAVGRLILKLISEEYLTRKGAKDY